MQPEEGEAGIRRTTSWEAAPPTQCDEIYRLIGESMQAVVVTPDPQEQVIAVSGTTPTRLAGSDRQGLVTASQAGCPGASRLAAASAWVITSGMPLPS